MATTYFKNAQAGGAANALDSIDGTNLSDGDRAYVLLPSGLTVTYTLDADAGLDEETTYYSVVKPDTNAGDKRWVRIWQDERMLIPDFTVDQGDANIVGTLAWHKANIGSDKATIRVGPGEHYLETAVSLGSNIKLKFDNGGYFKPFTAITLTVYSPEHIIASPRQQIVDTTNNSTDPLLFTSLSGDIQAGWWGASPDTTAAINADAMQLAINAALNGVGASALPKRTVHAVPGSYEIDTTLSVSAYRGLNIDFEGVTLTQANNTNLTELISLDNVRYGFIKVGLWGNKDNNTAVTGLKLVDCHARNFNVEVKASECDIGLLIYGDTETLDAKAWVDNCSVGVQEQGVGSDSPHENNIVVIGRQNDGPHYKKAELCGVSDVLVEGGTTSAGYGIELASGRTMLSGHMENPASNGVHVEGDGELAIVHFKDYYIRSAGGWGVYGGAWSRLAGTFHVEGAVGGVYIGSYGLEGSLTPNLDDITGKPAVQIGSATQNPEDVVIRGLIVDSTEEEALLVKAATRLDVDITYMDDPSSATNEIYFDATQATTDVKVSLPPHGKDYVIQDDGVTRLMIKYKGKYAYDQVNAIPTKIAGMEIEQYIYHPIYWDGSLWVDGNGRSGSYDSITLADDAATSITPRGDYGTAEVWNRTTQDIADYGMIAFGDDGVSDIKLGTDVESTTGALAGTTGTDGKVTISWNAADSKVYIENRLGSQCKFKVFIDVRYTD